MALRAEEGLVFLSLPADTAVQLSEFSQSPHGMPLSLLSTIKHRFSGSLVLSGGNPGCCEEPRPASEALATAAWWGLHLGMSMRSLMVCCGIIHLLFLQRINFCWSTKICHFAYILLIFFLL